MNVVRFFTFNDDRKPAWIEHIIEITNKEKEALVECNIATSPIWSLMIKAADAKYNTATGFEIVDQK